MWVSTAASRIIGVKENDRMYLRFGVIGFCTLFKMLQFIFLGVHCFQKSTKTQYSKSHVDFEKIPEHDQDPNPETCRGREAIAEESADTFCGLWRLNISYFMDTEKLLHQVIILVIALLSLS